MKKYRRPTPVSREVKAIPESKLEHTFYNGWRKEYPSIAPVLQHRFHPTRAWRFDFCWPAYKLAVEIQGFGEGHNSYEGMHTDYEKWNEATRLGWRVLYFMGVDLERKNLPRTLHYIHTIMTGRPYVEDRSYNRHWDDSINSARRRLHQKDDPRQPPR